MAAQHSPYEVRQKFENENWKFENENINGFSKEINYLDPRIEICIILICMVVLLNSFEISGLSPTMPLGILLIQQPCRERSTRDVNFPKPKGTSCTLSQKDNPNKLNDESSSRLRGTTFRLSHLPNSSSWNDVRFPRLLGSASKLEHPQKWSSCRDFND